MPHVRPTDHLAPLAEQCANGNARVTVDLERQVVISPLGEELPFTIATTRRTALLEGLDEIGLTMKHEATSETFQACDRTARPWVWL